MTSSNSPVASGDTLFLQATSYPGASYQWTGPNGFTSNNEDPQIPSASSFASGSYQLDVQLNGCSETSNVNVTVTSVSCNPPDSTASLSIAPYLLNFIVTVADSSGPQYQAGAGDIQLQNFSVGFGIPTAPVAGNYIVNPACSQSSTVNLASNEACVGFILGDVIGGNFNVYYGYSGTVTVAYVNGHREVSVCNMPFVLQGSSTISFTASVKITLP